jgi:hypothetical protein
VLEVDLLLGERGDEDALLELRDLAEAVHVQLPDERVEVVVLEPAPEHLAREPLVVDDCVGS